MKTLLIILSLTASFSGATQVNLDSLWGIWNNPSQSDTNKLKAIHKISKEGYLFTQPDSAFYFAQMQYDLAEEKGEKKYMADALNIQGTYYTNIGDYDQAIDNFTSSLKIFEEIGNRQGASGCLVNIGSIYLRQSHYDQALDYFTGSLKAFEELGDGQGAAMSLNNIGIIHRQRGNYDQAIDYHTRGLRVSEEIGNKEEVSKCLNNIGIIYKNQGNDSKAIDYYTRSLKIKEEIGNKRSASISLNNIGIIYENQEEYTKALDYYTRCLNIFEEIGDKRYTAGSLINIGSIFHKQGQNSKAIDSYTRSLKIFEEIGDRRGASMVLGNIGDVYKEQGDYNKAIDNSTQSLKISEEIGDKKGIASSLVQIGNSLYFQGNYSKAKENGEKALAIAQEIGVAHTIKFASSLLWKVNKKTGRYGPALEMHELYMATRDSIQSEENQRAVIRQEYKYTYEKQAAADSIKTAAANKVKDAQLSAEKAKTKQQKQQKYFLFAGLAMILLFGGIVFNRFRANAKQKLRNLALEKQISVEKLESASQHIREKLEIIEKLEGELESKSVSSDKNEMERISALFKENSYLDEPQWNEIIHHYDNVNDNFSKDIIQRFDKITKTDLKLLILVRMGFLNKEISAIRGTTISATKKAKQRLRVKLDTTDLLRI